MLGELPREEIFGRDMDFLLLGVAGKRDDLHAVEQRGRDRLQQIRRRDEHYAREVEWDFEVMVGETVVLLRIQHLQQRGARIAPEIGADLVYLVEHEYRVVAFGPAQSLDDSARQRPDVSP